LGWNESLLVLLPKSSFDVAVVLVVTAVEDTTVVAVVVVIEVEAANVVEVEVEAEVENESVVETEIETVVSVVRAAEAVDTVIVAVMNEVMFDVVGVAAVGVAGDLYRYYHRPPYSYPNHTPAWKRWASSIQTNLLFYPSYCHLSR